MKQHNMPTTRDWLKDMAIGGLYLAGFTAAIAVTAFALYLFLRWLM